MVRYEIVGSYSIRGRVRASVNKNAALPCIAACLLSDEPVILKNIPDIEDVNVMLEVIGELGATVERLPAKGEIRISPFAGNRSTVAPSSPMTSNMTL
ncbi:MAG: hypothetical protein E4H09_04875, partial [Spirochaetales bacterium]